jgi:hypothetical protein
MRTVARMTTLGAAALLSATAVAAVNSLTFSELISVVFFEDERAYLDTKSFFCRYIALSGPGDYCNASLRVLDPKTCKTEVLRELQVTYGGGAGREFMRSREVFTLASLDLTTLKEPEVDEKSGAFRQRFEAPIDIYAHEGFQYSFLLDEKGGYKACRIDGKELQVSEDDCVKAGTKETSTSKKMMLGFNPDKYNRSMAAIRWLQKTYCPAGGDPL